MSVYDSSIEDVPWAIVDVETSASTEDGEVIEVCVFRLDPTSPHPQRVLDTLVRPLRPVDLRWVHGLTGDSLREAPTMAEVSDRLWRSLEGAVLVAHNVSFEARFLARALRGYGPPLLCTQNLCRGLGVPVSGHDLQSVARAYQVPYTAKHRARDDAMAAAWIAVKQRLQMMQMGWRTYRDVATRCSGSYSFQGTLRRSLPVRPRGLMASAKPLLPRLPQPIATFQADAQREDLRREYAMGVFSAVADLQLSGDERRRLSQLRQGLSAAEVAAAHAQVMAASLSTYAADSVLDDAEIRRIQLMHECLMELGWAPGMPGVMAF